MPLTLNAEQQLLRDNARQFIDEAAPVGELRRLRDSRDPDGFSRALWRQMIALGWPASVFPEAYGGSDLGYTELGILFEACGATLAASPLLSSVVLAGGALLDAGSAQQKSELLPALCEGRVLMALAFEETARFSPYTVACKAERTGHGYKLTGHKRFVLDGHVAQQMIVTARTSGAVGERHGISLFLLDAAQPGVKVERVAMLDSRNAALCTFEGVLVPETAVLGALDRGADVLDRVLDRATICLAAEMLGLATRAFEITLEYLKTRVQFDEPIGSFQALQHRAVDMFCELELAKSVSIDALSALDEHRTDVSAMASAAKARLCDVSRQVTREAVQLHGGIGMTDEHDIGLYLKRAAVAEATFGDAAYHRDRFAALKGF
jgi:alkylation response protein AidB-like acyl-CoA dehydrogenase